MKKGLTKAILATFILGLVVASANFTNLGKELEAKFALASITQAFANNEYQAKLVETPPFAINLAQGESINVVARFQNIGESVWYTDFMGNSSVSLIASRDYGRKSALADSSTWENASEIIMQETKVEQDEIATFSFNLKAPSKDESYREYFQLLSKDGAYLGPEFFFDVHVGTADGEVLGASAQSTTASDYADYLARQDITNYQAEFTEQAAFPELEEGEVGEFYFKFKNTGSVTWYTEGENALTLRASNPDDRESRFANKSWEDENKIAMQEDQVAPGEIATFEFELDTKDVDSNVYREYFSLVASNVGSLPETYGTYLEVKVGNTDYDFSDLEGSVASTFAGRDKEIWINLEEQLAYLVEDGEIMADMRTSSGRPGMETPIGDFNAMRKEVRHWSVTYQLWMPYAIQFTKRGHYLHALPVWPNGYEEGRNHLGWAISHGCVRLEYPEQLFNWAKVGTPIKIRANFEDLQNM